jgi:hypothetical protein
MVWVLRGRLTHRKHDAHCANAADAARGRAGLGHMCRRAPEGGEPGPLRLQVAVPLQSGVSKAQRQRMIQTHILYIYYMAFNAGFARQMGGGAQPQPAWPTSATSRSSTAASEDRLEAAAARLACACHNVAVLTLHASGPLLCFNRPAAATSSSKSAAAAAAHSSMPAV